MNLEKKKVEVISTVHDNIEQMDTVQNDSTDDEGFDEFLDWRAKKSFK